MRGLFDLSCSQCGRVMEYTKSGYLTCPMGHGRLLVAPGVCSASSEPDMFAQAQGSDCEWCGRDAQGGRYCAKCVQVLERNAKGVAGV